MKPLVKKILLGVGAVFGLGAIGAGSYVMLQVRAFDESMARVYKAF